MDTYLKLSQSVIFYGQYDATKLSNSSYVMTVPTHVKKYGIMYEPIEIDKIDVRSSQCVNLSNCPATVPNGGQVKLRNQAFVIFFVGNNAQVEDKIWQAINGI